MLGCAFLTYAKKQSAINAIQALHDKVKLPNVSVYNTNISFILYYITFNFILTFLFQAINPLQIRPAESPSERENKIFVGMLPKSISEAELLDMFSRYGQLKEVIFCIFLLFLLLELF